MRILSLRYINWPGIKFDESVELGNQPVHLVVGSNGSGKSSLGRAIQGLLWPDGEDRHREIEAICEHDGTEYRAILRSGATTWIATDGSSRQLQPVGASAHCHLLTVSDLLDAKGGGDQRLAESITKAMFGGISPAELRETYKQAKRKPAQVTDLEKCRTLIRRLIEEEENVFADEKGIEQLDLKIKAAGAAKQSQADVDNAIELAEKTDLLSQAEAYLHSFDGAHAVLEDGDLKRIKALQDDLGSIDEQVRGLKAGCDRDRAIAEDPLQLTEVDQARLGSLPEELADLRVAEQALGQAKEDDDTAQRELTQCRSHCLSEERLSNVSIGDVSALQQSLNDRAVAQAEVAGMEKLFNYMKPTVAARPRAELEKSISWLQAWLAAEDSGGQGSPPDRRLMWAGLAVVGLGALLTFLTPWAAVFSLLGAGVVLKSQSAAAGSVSQERSVVEKNMATSDVDGPKSWVRDAVGARLLQLLEERGECITQEDRSKWLDAQAREINELSTALQGLDSECAERLSELGLQPGLLSVEAGVLLRRFADLDEAEKNATKTESKLAIQQEDVKLRAEQIRSFLNSHIEVDGSIHDSLRASAKALTKRWEGVAGARARRDAAVQKTKELNVLCAKKVRVHDRIFERLSLEIGDVRGVEALHSLHDEYLKADKDRGNAEFLRNSVLEKLEECSELKERELEDLRDEKSRLAEMEAAKDSLVSERQSIIDRVKRAREDSSLAAERSEENGLLESLQEHRDQQVKKAMARAMIDRTLAHFNKEHAPDVLRQARDLFGQFTQGDYRLRINSEDQTSAFEAEDRKAEIYSLDTLSDGTRMQLLIAVRLAFAQHNEGNVRLPLILDEALSTSDPDRFEAVAEALFQLSDSDTSEGRQIIYMTANPNDVHPWNQLARAKGRALPNQVPLDDQAKRRMAAESERPLPPIRKPAPSAEGLDALSYRNAIGAPKEDHTDPQSLWLVYLLQDELELVECLLNKRIETIGDWQTAVEQGVAEELVTDPAVRAHLSERCESGLRALRDYAVGRGRKVKKEDLTKGGISRRMLERVWEHALAADCNGNGFVARLRDPKIKIKSFKSGVRDQLIDHLERCGISDPMPIRSETLEF